MKKIIVILSMLATQVISAQTEKGKFLLGASVNYSQGKTSSTYAAFPSVVGSEGNNKNFGDNLRLGYFFTDNFAAGVLVTNSFGSGYSKSNGNNPANPNETTSKSNLTSLGVFARGYKLFNNNKFGFFCELSGSFMFGTQKTNDKYPNGGVQQSDNSNSEITGFNIGLKPGFAYFITKKIGLEVSVGNLAFNNQKTVYSYDGIKATVAKSNNFNFNLNASTLYIGATFYLGGKKN